MERTLEQRTIAKVSWRLLPLIVVIYFVAYMDRTNVSFASLSMKGARVATTSLSRANAKAYPQAPA